MSALLGVTAGHFPMARTTSLHLLPRIGTPFLPASGNDKNCTIGLKGSMGRNLSSTRQPVSGIFSHAPEPHVAFCSILSTQFFLFLNTMFKNESF